MTTAHHRKKAPQQVRRALLDCATHMAVQKGLAGISLRTVAAAAGVTKGGLLHHFADRQAFITAVCDDLIRSLDALIDRHMAEDGQNRYGSFTRAYVMAALTPVTETPWALRSLSLLTDPGLRNLWSAWMQERLRKHTATDSDPTLAMVRYAADGVWLSILTQEDMPPDSERNALCAQLLALIEERV